LCAIHLSRKEREIPDFDQTQKVIREVVMAKMLAFLQSKDIVSHNMTAENAVIDEHLLLCLQEVQSLSGVDQTGTDNVSNDLSNQRASLGKLLKDSSKANQRPKQSPRSTIAGSELQWREKPVYAGKTCLRQSKWVDVTPRERQALHLLSHAIVAPLHHPFVTKIVLLCAEFRPSDDSDVRRTSEADALSASSLWASCGYIAQPVGQPCRSDSDGHRNNAIVGGNSPVDRFFPRRQVFPATVQWH
jgi:hypothetical protein